MTDNPIHLPELDADETSPYVHLGFSKLHRAMRSASKSSFSVWLIRSAKNPVIWPSTCTVTAVIAEPSSFTRVFVRSPT
jgi:hypothetical protein